MKSLVLFSFLAITILLPVVEGIFLGPIAVGAVIGALAVKKGFILGSLLSRRRSHTQYYRQGRSYSPYRRSYHYDQQPEYYNYYTKSKTYYYSSNRRGYSYRGKRFAPEITAEEVERYKREVADKFMTDEWFMEMVEKDQDDCTKRLICEVAHKTATGSKLNGVEQDVYNIFGKGTSVDTSKSTAIFDFAAQAGKYWKKGGVGCDFYRRCETPVADILSMIETEIDDFEQLEQSVKGDSGAMEKEMVDEKSSVQEMLTSLDNNLIVE